MTVPTRDPRLVGSLVALVLAATLAAMTPARSTAQTMAAPVATTATTMPAVLWSSTGDPARPLREPSFLAVDPQGALWVADSQHDQFQLLAPDGAWQESWGASGSGPGQFDFVRSDEIGLGAVAFARDGTLYVADTGNDRVQVFAPDHHWLASWGASGREDGQFVDPIGIAVGPDGLVYVVDDYRDDIQVFDPQGAFVRKFGEEGIGPGQFVDAGSGIALDHAGNILVTDVGGDQVERFAPDGAYLDTWGGTGGNPGQFSGPQGIAVDAQGQVYVTDSSNYRVQVFSPEGAFLTAWGSVGSAPGQFRLPVALALDGQGHIYVSDTFDNRIQAFQLGPPLALGAGAAGDPVLVPATVAAALGVTPSSDQSIEAALARQLRPRQSLLLLGNCDHVVSDTADFRNRRSAAGPRAGQS